MREAEFTAAQVASAIGITVVELHALRSSGIPEHSIAATAGEGTRSQLWSGADAARLAVLHATGSFLSRAGRKAVFRDLKDRHLEQARRGERLWLINDGFQSIVGSSRKGIHGGAVVVNLTAVVHETLTFCARCQRMGSGGPAGIAPPSRQKTPSAEAEP